MRQIDTDTRLCAVIGNPVGHSLSPAMHNAAFAAMQLNYVYLAFQVADVAGCLAGLRALRGFRGLSVTIPHKEAVIPHLDEIDPMAQRVGSVNTVVNDNGRLKGYTTDGPGTVRAFDDAGIALKGRSVALLGAGGAVRAVAFALLEMGRAERVTIVGRTAQRVDALAADLQAAFKGQAAAASLSDVERLLDDHDIVVQGTPTGMYPNDVNKTLVPKRALKPRHIVFDMVYRPMQTRLIQEAQAVGCQTILGLEMLLNQAAIQFELWTEKPAPRHAMRQALLKALSAEPS